MALRTRQSVALKNLQQRNAKVVTINSKYDLGNGVEASAVEKQVDELTAAVAKYNALIAAANGASARVRILEAGARTTHRRMLKGVEMKYGADSEQYQQAGGVRTSTIKRARGVKKALREQEQQQAEAHATIAQPASTSVITGGNGVASNGVTSGAGSNGVANGTSIHS